MKLKIISCCMSSVCVYCLWELLLSLAYSKNYYTQLGDKVTTRRIAHRKADCSSALRLFYPPTNRYCRQLIMNVNIPRSVVNRRATEIWFLERQLLTFSTMCWASVCDFANYKWRTLKIKLFHFHIKWVHSLGWWIDVTGLNNTIIKHVF